MPVWHPVGVTNRDGGWSSATSVTSNARRDAEADVAFTQRRAAASFGGGGPRFGDGMRDFIRRYGWRAYALPLLLVVTVVALITMSAPDPSTKPTADANKGNSAGTQATGSSTTGGGTATHSGNKANSSPPVAPKSITMKKDTPQGKAYQQAIKHAALPAGAPYTKAGTGTFRVLQGTTKIVGTSGTLYRYDIEVENGIKGINLQQYQRMIDSTLDDPRSWTGHGIRLERVDSGQVDFHISLTSSMTVRKYCGYEIHVESSCYVTAGSVAAATANRVVLNDSRWVRGAATYVGDLHAYRIYLINHEDGHALGHQHAHECLPNGMAPAMMQQTFGLKSAVNGDYCTANPWPYPPGVKGAPGAEQPDTTANNEFNLVD